MEHEAPEWRLRVEEFSIESEAYSAVDVVLAGLKTQFADADLRAIAYALLDHISPTIDPDSAAPVYPRPYPPRGI